MMRAAVLSLLATAGIGAVAFVGPANTVEPKTRVALRASMKPLPESQDPEQSPVRAGGAFLSMVAALVLVLLPVQEAQAARSGGRIGGTASAARSKPPPRAPVASSSSKTTVINKTTVITPPPPVVAAPPIGMGMGVGFAPAPVVVAPPPTLGDVVVGTVIGGAINNAITGGHHSGPTSTDRLLENQQRQDERQMDNQQREIELLKSEIQNLKSTK
ncbi:unnamed protein product [Durusdinium trenchii]|uniref:Uncharacterized protein n=1 Tax=Durusdinium trenchii TaxID=1381693 RepID=A0ABP0M2R5_9DINO